jgi:hypothetical protein
MIHVIFPRKEKLMTGLIVGTSIPRKVSATYGWGVLFNGFGIFVLLATVILPPKWNVVLST